VLAVYGGGFVVGATLDSFPASSAYLIELRGFSDAQYGSIYIPQLLAALVGAVGGGMASRIFSLRRLVVVSMVSFLIAQSLLALCGSKLDFSVRTAWFLVMGATAAFGFGFGFGGGPLNGLVARQFPAARNAALTAFHMCAGAGLAIAPFIFSRFAAAGHWIGGIASLGGLTVLVLALSATASLPDTTPSREDQPSARSPARDPVFWVLVGVSIAYALVEGTFSNWAVLYVQDDLKMPPATAANALAAFWGGLTVGRLLLSVVSLRVKPIAILCALPLCMILALLVVRSIDTPGMAIGGFAVAGLGCSAFFPMLVGFAAETHPQQVSWLAAMLTAALMVGVGLGSYAIGELRASFSIRQLYAYAMAYPLLALTGVLIARGMRVRSQVRSSA
jgi:fucose permease